MTSARRPAYFVGGGPLAGHSYVELLPDGRPQSRLRVMLSEGPLVRLAGSSEPLPRARTYGIYELRDDADEGSLIYEFLGEESD
ncbi:MAG: hypothetical protein H0W01_07410 [Pseudonocardiales bacterium]|jgi:hypothetical protein|nr:hypothetical protein [Pseudonocardiales bacterium]